MLANVNAARADSGLPALLADGLFQDLANQWAEYLVNTGAFAHRDNLSAIARRCRLLLITENVWQNIAFRTPEDIVGDWLNSPGHQDNLLSATSKLGAAAIRIDPDGRTVAVFQGGSRLPGKPLSQGSAECANTPEQHGAADPDSKSQ